MKNSTRTRILASLSAAIGSAILTYVSSVKFIGPFVSKGRLDKKSIQSIGIMSAISAAIIGYMTADGIILSTEIENTREWIKNSKEMIDKDYEMLFGKKPVEGVTFISDEEAEKEGKKLQEKINSWKKVDCEATEVVED